MWDIKSQKEMAITFIALRKGVPGRSRGMEL